MPVVWLLTWRNRAGAGAPRGRRDGPALARLAAIVAALLRPTFPGPAKVSVVYVFDVSSSVSPRFWMTRWTGSRSQRAVTSPRSRASWCSPIMPSCSNRLTTCGPSARRRRWAGRERRDRSNATDLEEGLVAALPGFAPGLVKRVVLLSDGNQTEGDAGARCCACRQRACACSPFPRRSRPTTMPGSKRSVVPQGVRERAAVQVEGPSILAPSVPARVELTIDERNRLRTVTLSPGDNRVSFFVRFPQTGAHVTARVSAKATSFRATTRLTEDVYVQPRPHALYVEAATRRALPGRRPHRAGHSRVVRHAANLSDDPQLLRARTPSSSATCVPTALERMWCSAWMCSCAIMAAA